MYPSIRITLSLILFLFTFQVLAAETVKRPLQPADLWLMKRVSEPVSSPDGQWVLFTVKTYDVDANKGSSDIWIANIDDRSFKPFVEAKGNDDSAVFSSDGKNVFFLSTRSGSSQVWRISSKGGAQTQVTSLPTDVNGFKVFQDGKTLLLALEVYPESKDLKSSLENEKAINSRQGNYMRYDQLLFRHWDTWEDGKRSHLFVYKSDKTLTDLMQGMDVDAPTHPFGGMEEVDISSDGKTVVFTARSDGSKAAITNNVDLFSVDVSGEQKPVNITISNLAWDSTPVFSPDGKTLAYLSMNRPGYESDRVRIKLMDGSTQKITTLTEGWDRSPTELSWSPDGKTLWVSADHVGNHPLFSVDALSGKVNQLTDKGESGSPKNITNNSIVFLKSTMTSPNELWTMKSDGKDQKQLTKLNSDRLSTIQWGEYEQFSFPGHKGEKVFGYIMKPAGWNGQGKVPVAFLIHGGPQGSWIDHFHYRWNPEVFAGQGYAAVFIDFHGSTGYGQKFTDAIRGNWGSAPYIDLMKGLDYALKKYLFLDSKNVFALGASYGGYMINWINGNTNRFKAMVCHDGNIDEHMSYFDTEELWFPEWEHGGLPWKNPKDYQKYNPVNLVKNWKTPVLVIHGGKDYRVVDTQGLSTFTALQRKGIKSRLLYFPEQNHWVLKPQNSLVWHKEIFGWMKEFQ